MPFSYSVLADIITVALIILFALRGRKRGLVKTVAGILVVIIAFFGAGYLANLTTPYISENFVEPKIRNYIVPQSEAVEASKAEEPRDADGISESISKMLIKIGIPQDTVTEAVGSFSFDGENSISGAITDISDTISQKITYAVSCLICFVLLILILSLLVRLINMFTKIPGLNFINKTGGLLLGLVFGYIAISLTAAILTNTGILLSKDILEKTIILRFISETNLLSFVL